MHVGMIEIRSSFEHGKLVLRYEGPFGIGRGKVVVSPHDPGFYSKIGPRHASARIKGHVDFRARRAHIEGKVRMGPKKWKKGGHFDF